MEKKAYNKKLLNEELQRFRQINEYDFYVGEDYKDYDNPENLILGEEGEEDDLGIEDLPADDSKTAEANADDDAVDLSGDEELDDEYTDEDGLEGFDDEEDDNVETDDDEVELDVTDLVQGTEEAKESADMANKKIDQLMKMLDNLDDKLDSMNSITTKIDNLENELEKRAPTPEEKIEMRSLYSYPYNLKLTDFWAEKDGQYNVLGVNNKNNEPEEYTLTQQDVSDEYNESQIKKSFDIDNEYEEEDF